MPPHRAGDAGLLAVEKLAATAPAPGKARPCRAAAAENRAAAPSADGCRNRVKGDFRSCRAGVSQWQ